METIDCKTDLSCHFFLFNQIEIENDNKSSAILIYACFISSRVTKNQMTNWPKLVFTIL